eukprot:m.158122 g.158122  ORF g.158122 m.158122 type:complete len:281 (-) comp52978_c0_seq13:946-1788(-)
MMSACSRKCSSPSTLSRMRLASSETTRSSLWWRTPSVCRPRRTSPTPSSSRSSSSPTRRPSASTSKSSWFEFQPCLFFTRCTQASNPKPPEHFPRDPLQKCLFIFGGGNQTTLKMNYNGHGCPLVLELEDTGVVTDCSIRTLLYEENIDLDIRATNVTCNIIMKSEWLTDVFGELDMTSEFIQFYISPDAPHFRLGTTGNAGSWQLDCPKDSEVMENFVCHQTTVYFYKLKFVKRFEKTLALSKKLSLRINDWGTMSMQFLIQTDIEPIFVEFLCLPESE